MAKKSSDKDSIETRLDIESQQQMPLQRINFILMGIAGAMIVLGFLLMTGAPATADTFNPDIFSTRRIVVGPTITFLGFVFMAVAIAWNPKKETTKEFSKEESPENK